MIGTRVEWSREGYTWSGEVVEQIDAETWLVETPLGQERTMTTAQVLEHRVVS